jgi:hypothetical protein
MFTSENVRCHIAKCALRTEELKKDERSAVMSVGLVIEPLTYDLAKELGPEVAEHCFTNKGKVREQVTNVRVRLREKPQALTVKMAEDVSEPTAMLRHVRVTHITITKRGIENDQKEATKGKKIAPQAVTLRATVSCLVDPAERIHREFLCRYINDFLLFTFTPEQKDMFSEMREDDEDAGDDEPQQALGLEARTPDPDAGEVLDDQAEADRRTGKGTKPKAGPKLVKSKAADQVH